MMGAAAVSVGLLIFASAHGDRNDREHRPGAASSPHPTPAPLVFRDINILAVTDVHSWIGGHNRDGVYTQQPLNATFGSLVSVVERAKAAAAREGKDVFLVDNGDVVDGTGLSNIAPDHCTELLPLLQMIPFDALNCGNHELYDNATMERFASSGYIASWKGRYLTSNLLNATTHTPLGATSAVLSGAVSGVRLLAFGFMYNMTPEEGLCKAVRVVTVEQTIASDWFLKQLVTVGRGVDALLILAHMDADESLLTAIVAAVRPVLPHIPIQIIAGHSHQRKTASIDRRAGVFEPGNYWNTLGFASFGLPSRHGDDIVDTTPVDFTYVDIDTTTAALAAAVNTTAAALPTPRGAAVAAQIDATEGALGLDVVVGCSNRTFTDGEMWSLFMERVIPETLFEPPRNTVQWFVQSTGASRSVIHKGNFTQGDVFEILPFGNRYFAVNDVPGSALAAAFMELNSDPSASYVSTDPVPDPGRQYDALFVSFDAGAVCAALQNATGHAHAAVPYRPALNGTAVLMKWARHSMGEPCPAIDAGVSASVR